MAIDCWKAGRLAELVRHYGQVERALCGHVHRPIQVRWAGTMGSVSPSTAHQASLDLREKAPLSMTMGRRAWRCICGGMAPASSRTGYVGNYEGPRPFR